MTERCEDENVQWDELGEEANEGGVYIYTI